MPPAQRRSTGHVITVLLLTYLLDAGGKVIADTKAHSGSKCHRLLKQISERGHLEQELVSMLADVAAEQVEKMVVKKRKDAVAWLSMARSWHKHATTHHFDLTLDFHDPFYLLLDSPFQSRFEPTLSSGKPDVAVKLRWQF
ncbi:hypothetical protein B0H16DRAFT_1470642 [Mycena metata]|uniref:Uncharacterized protein n=1 Tax=Mycena metata TaxID=1033252 RepID=A0AAD7HTM4_9AGAR|nr:hypothetical protein B0H16DRAFT_1470642 [Mycena metata]